MFQPPKLCPECLEPTIFEGEYLICSNKDTCPAQSLGRLKIWISENNILEWGDKVLKKVLDTGLASDVGDLYRLTENQLSNLDRMGEKSAHNLVEILKKHRSIPLENLIGGLGIENAATSTTKLVIKAGYDTLDAIFSMSISEFEAIDGFGEIKAKAFYNGLKENKSRIDDILSSGVSIRPPIRGTLTGKTLCFTGKSTLPRPQLHKLVNENGGEIKKSVGKSVDYLVIADPSSTSSKANAARKLGVKLISEEQKIRVEPLIDKLGPSLNAYLNSIRVN